MTRNEKELQAIINGYANNYDGSNNADSPIVVPRPAPVMNAAGKVMLGAQAGNPDFSAQFDLQLLLFYFTLNTGTGVFTAIANAALNAALKTKLPVFLFGLTDYFAGFTKIKQQYPLQGGWGYNAPFAYAKDLPFVTIAGVNYQLDATAMASLQNGDVVIPYTAVVGGVNYVALAVVRCSQVAYSTLLQSMASERFKTTMLRYNLADTSAAGLLQYANNIGVYHQTLFGKFTTDFVSPNSFKIPEQQQNGVIDIPLKTGLNQNTTMAINVNYNSDASITWSMFVDSVKKLAV